MKKIIIVFCIAISCISCGGYRIEQETANFLDKGYNIHTLIWKGDKIVWAHYTFQEWRDRLYIPLDSVPAVKARNYKEAERIMNILKQSNYHP